MKLAKKVNKQVPCGYSINVYTYKVYIEKHQSNIVIAVKMLLVIFLKKCVILHMVLLIFTNLSMIDLTEREINEYENAKYCHICKKVFGKAKKHRKVRDHDHYTGKLRGAAHPICNLRYSTQKDIPVFFHSGANYDFNLIIHELAKKLRSELQCIPLNGERFMSFSIPIKKKTYANSKNAKKRHLLIV